MPVCLIQVLACILAHYRKLIPEAGAAECFTLEVMLDGWVLPLM
jgi:hypothetical protein